VVITEAGTHDKVAALVYIAAFAPDAGESVGTLIAGPPPGAPVPPILPPGGSATSSPVARRRRDSGRAYAGGPRTFSSACGSSCSLHGHAA
jgi:hypothetical protein